ncbi:hypothetical protein AKJ09_02284 [Labilithrix luteola]|uniref:Uncharacterized protein n=1 Tax=Labilithrix luteola TaxID=1391654 RepID=A0A0K1PQ02_9BACT|nr:hypothetical protein AKJ09_02284 [Labilithrix luteola]
MVLMDPEASCSACRATFDEWAALELVARIESTEVERLIRGWSANLCIEVRACRWCGKGITRKCEWVSP